MDRLKHAPGRIRDAIVAGLDLVSGDASIAEIHRAVEARIGAVPASSVRSYLRLNPDRFERTGRGRYRLRRNGETA
ncbi:MAG: hypothetical protein OXN81_07360 [Alphaproteobacteria bacterium]|nr:hypothetical protein [Alphaproteobacteria bacterium]